MTFLPAFNEKDALECSVCVTYLLAYDLCGASRQIGGEKGFAGGGRFSLAWPFAGHFALTTQHHDPHEVPREHGMPQAIPGLDRGARFAGVRRPPQGGLHERLGRANQVTFFAAGTATLCGGGGGSS